MISRKPKPDPGWVKEEEEEDDDEEEGRKGAEQTHYKYFSSFVLDTKTRPLFSGSVDSVETTRPHRCYPRLTHCVNRQRGATQRLMFKWQICLTSIFS